jgi:hypothetical protein
MALGETEWSTACFAPIRLCDWSVHCLACLPNKQIDTAPALRRRRMAGPPAGQCWWALKLVRLTHNLVDPPAIGHGLQLVLTDVLERQLTMPPMI